MFFEIVHIRLPLILHAPLNLQYPVLGDKISISSSSMAALITEPYPHAILWWRCISTS